MDDEVSPFSGEGSTRTGKEKRRAARLEVTWSDHQHRLARLISLHRNGWATATLFAAIAWRETDKQYIAARHLFHLGHATFEVLHVFVTSGFPQLELL